MRQRRGFTLVEMAIVLVIVGLLIGGILAAQGMISNVRNRKAISQIQQYLIVITQFQDRFSSLPGDMPNAVTVFGAGTSNGNGDGHIDFNGIQWGNEAHRAWQQLNLAGMLEHSYLGTPAPVSPAYYGWNDWWVPDVTEPAGAHTNSLYYLNYQDGTDATLFNIKGNFIGYAGRYLVPYAFTSVSAKDALAIDAKIDDGKPDTGSVTSTNAPECSSAVAGYIVSTGDIGCRLYISLGL
jgi:prepilin-type N-terminal cleavage/methylation domain-containing protein